MPTPSAPSSTSGTRLAQLEKIIEAGMDQFFAVGKALKEIHDAELYKPAYGTWEGYCRGRWGFGRHRGYQLISAFVVSTNVNKAIPEGQARILAKQPPEVQRQALAQVSAAGKVTAAALEEMVSQINAEEEERLRNAPPAERPKREDSRSSARARLDQIRGLCKRLKRLHAGLVDVADEADAILEAYLAKCESTTES